MRTTEIILCGPRTQLPRVSVLGLGCAAMLGRAGRRDSLAALGAAYDAGITFYDTARSYGYGACEGLLGEFFAGKKRIGKDFEINGTFAYEHWKAPVYLPGQQTVTTTTIQLTWFPGRKVSF